MVFLYIYFINHDLSAIQIEINCYMTSLIKYFNLLIPISYYDAYNKENIHTFFNFINDKLFFFLKHIKFFCIYY